jgi:hypothetical protein
MTERQPTQTNNLDIYGHEALPWSRAHEALLAIPPSEELTWFLGTVRPDGRPSAAGVGAIYFDGEVYFTSSPEARKARNLAENPACTISVRLKGLDLVFAGDAVRLIDAETLERVAARYREGGWPVEVAKDAFTAPFSAPSAGPPPWQLYRLEFTNVVGVAGAEPFGATRWTFDRSD